MSTFLVVGKNFSGLRNKILERNDNYILLQDSLATRFPGKKLKNRVVVSFSKKGELLAAVEPLRGKVDGVITVYENYVLPAAWIADHLGLPGLPIKAAEAATDKFLMRQKFALAPKDINPDFQEINSEDDLRSFGSSHSFPLILKPANLQKSLLVTKNQNLDELLGNYQKTLDQLESIYSRHSPHRKPKLIVEQFIEGPIYSVDAFINAEGKPQVLQHIVDYQTGYDIGYSDNFHYSRLLPSKLPAPLQEQIREVAAMGIRALGMKSSAAHIEIILSPSGPKIVEIGARNGGYRERMHKLSNGLDLMGLALDNALGKPISVKSDSNEPTAVLELFPKTPGIFKCINSEADLHRLKSLEYFTIKQPLGKHVGKSSEGYKMCAIIILHNSDPAVFMKDLEFVNKQVYVVT